MQQWHENHTAQVLFLVAFLGAFVAYSHVPGLDALLRRIPVYPDAGHESRIKAFYSMAFIQHWLMHEAERHGNAYTMTRAASQLALFCGRLILDFQDWGVSDLEAYTWFMTDVEWSWMSGSAPIEDW